MGLLKTFSKYILYRIPVWLLVMVVSITLFYSLSILLAPKPGKIHPSVVEGVAEVRETAYSVSKLKYNVSTNVSNPVIPVSINVVEATLLIFLNNLKTSLFFAIPLAGAVFYGYALVYNAMVTSYLGLTVNMGDYTWIVKLVLSQPHTYLEILGYSIVVSESTRLGYLLLTRRVARHDIVFYLVSLLLATIVLGVAAYIEVNLV